MKAYLAAAAVAVTLAVLIPADLATAQPRQAERAPECVTARIVYPGQRAAFIEWCGAGPGRESPLRSWAARAPHALDGSTAITPRQCTKAAPCVLFATNGPQS